ncbi:MAG: glycosyltransferase family 4 protein [Acidimicrobiia bacterium]
MRVLMVSSLWPPEVLGGAELYAAALADRLRTAGHEVGVVTAGTAGDDVVARLPTWGYPITDYATQPPARRMVFHAGDVLRPDAGRVMDDAIARFRPDVVHSHAVLGMSATSLTRVVRRHVPHVHTLHDYWLLCQRAGLVNRAGIACTTRCTGCRAVGAVRNAQLRHRPPEVVIAVSEAIAAIHHAELPWLRDRTRVLYNPVDEPHTGRRRPPAGAPTFGFVGQVSRVKGIGTLLRAFTDAGIPDARLVVAGRGPDLELVPRDSPAIDAPGWVSRERLDEIYATIDCLVVPSEWQDPAPLVVNEARARGIPVIGARSGGIPELVAPECEALLFAAGDVVALVERLRTFAARPDDFIPTPAAAPMGWTEHLVGIEAAYRDAGVQVQATERGRG